MKPLIFKGIPLVDSYEAMTISEKVIVGVTYEAMLRKTYHAEVAKHLAYLKELALCEMQFYLMNAVETFGEKLGIDYRLNIVLFDKAFAKKHPQQKFFTHALIDCDSFTEIVEIKKIIQPLIRDIKKNPESYLETKMAG